MISVLSAFLSTAQPVSLIVPDAKFVVASFACHTEVPIMLRVKRVGFAMTDRLEGEIDWIPWFAPMPIGPTGTLRRTSTITESARLAIVSETVLGNLSLDPR